MTLRTWKVAAPPARRKGMGTVLTLGLGLRAAGGTPTPCSKVHQHPDRGTRLAVMSEPGQMTSASAVGA